jgi:hypothetical protein
MTTNPKRYQVPFANAGIQVCEMTGASGENCAKGSRYLLGMGIKKAELLAPLFYFNLFLAD